MKPRIAHDAASARGGFTAVELLVAIAIISLLLSLLLPAVQQARERSRQVQCTSHLAQFGKGFTAYEALHGRFPPGCKAITNPPHPPLPPPLPTPRKWVPYAVSAHYALLPFLEQSAVYEQVVFTDPWSTNGDPPSIPDNDHVMQTRIPVFGCPSDDVPIAATSYRLNAGTSSSYHLTRDLPPPNSALDGFGRRCVGKPAARVTDGLSQTVAFAERLVGDQDPAVYTPSRDTIVLPNLGPIHDLLVPDGVALLCQTYSAPDAPHTSFDGTGWLLHRLGTTTYNHILSPNSITPDCGGLSGGAGAYTPRSLHPGGVFVCMGDGAVRFVSESIDQNVWRAAGTIAGGEVAQLP